MQKIASKTQVNIITVDENQVEQRIDNFLIRRLKGVPKSRIYRIIRKGEVRVNKKRIKQTYKLQLGDQVRIPPIRVATRETSKPSERVMQLLHGRILYEDDNLLVINKPSGIAVHGGSGINFGVIEIFREMRPEAKFIELVHRIDRETSGCLMLAKKRSVLKELHELLREGKVEKIYLALLRGKWQGGKRRVEVPIKEGKVSDLGKSAVTVFNPKQKFNNATLMEAKLKTGRTHQIRIHAAYLGCPIAGDSKYGDREFNKTMKKAGLKRLFLHAHSLKFRLPSTDEVISVTAELDDELLKVQQQLVIICIC